MSNGWQLFVEWVLAHLTDVQIGLVQGVATAFWWCAKLINAVATFLIEEDLWSLIVSSLLTVIEDTMPTIYGALIFSPTGVFYIALMLAGILLIIGYGDTQFADPSQVILWGILTFVLFVSTTASIGGYDLISFFESARRWTAVQPITIMAPSGNVSDLIATPMRANSAETTDLSFSLPNQYITEFFYQPAAGDMETRTGVFLDTWLTGQVTIDFQFERADRQETRRQASWNGLLLSALTLAPATLELFFGIIFATIAAAVLVIIILFLACIPLGFFSFGKDILSAIITQYFVMWGLTIASGIAVGALLGAGEIFLPANPSISAVVLYLPVLIVVGIAVSFLLSLSYRVMLGTFGMLTATLRATITRDAQNTRLPQGGELPLSGSLKRAFSAAQGVAGLAVLGTTAAMTGGTSAMLPALAGGVLSRSDGRTGRDAALLARVTSNSPAARTFSAAAMTPKAIPSAFAVYAVNRTNGTSSNNTPARRATRPSRPETTNVSEIRGTNMPDISAETLPSNNHCTASPQLTTRLPTNDFMTFADIVRDGMREASVTNANALEIVAARLADHPTTVDASVATRMRFASHLLEEVGHSAETTPPRTSSTNNVNALSDYES